MEKPINKLLDFEKWASDKKFYQKQNLFGPDFSQLDKKRCPHCLTKLYPLLKKPGWSYCRSKKHKAGKVWQIK